MYGNPSVSRKDVDLAKETDKNDLQCPRRKECTCVCVCVFCWCWNVMRCITLRAVRSAFGTGCGEHADMRAIMWTTRCNSKCAAIILPCLSPLPVSLCYASNHLQPVDAVTCLNLPGLVSVQVLKRHLMVFKGYRLKLFQEMSFFALFTENFPWTALYIMSTTRCFELPSQQVTK